MARKRIDIRKSTVHASLTAETDARNRPVYRLKRTSDEIVDIELKVSEADDDGGDND